MAAAESEVRAAFARIFEPLDDPHRYKVCLGGRGGGRSWAYARALLIAAWQKPLRVLCTREIQRSIKDSVHQLLCDQIKELGLQAHYTIKNDEIVGDNGSKFIFAGLRQQEILNLKSMEAIDRVWVEEAQSVSEKSWQILIPTIRRPGSEIWITFNPGLVTDPTYERFIEHSPPDTVIIRANYRDNPWFPAELEAERLHCKQYDPDSYENIWEGVPRHTVDGAIYHREIVDAINDKRIRPVPRDPVIPVHTIWDLGWNDQTSIIFCQRIGAEIRIIDYLEDSHRTLDDYVGDIENRKWKWGTDYLPHDGDARSLQTGMSPAEILRKLKRKVHVIPAVKVEVGIKAARMIFRQCYFDEVKTKRLIECLRRYRRNIPVTTDEPSTPVHDEHSHGADAFRMLALIADKMRNDEMQPIKYSNAGIV
ncbi:MAG: PBSX family phage terminase large subunit [Nitrospira sp.]|nr:PBSX family phage terminase large subunit [Nitrospira sp.]